MKIPPIDPLREQALLAAFDAHWARPQPKTHGSIWRAAAVLAAVSVGLNWLVITNPPRREPVGSEPAFDLSGFVTWPGADAIPPFESGSLIRVDLPVSALRALGLVPPYPAASVVQADIVVGQDGLARAVRLVQ